MSPASGSGEARCIGEPVSWLRLERFRLGEIGGEDSIPIAEHLAACSACAACLERIREDEVAVLPALPAAEPFVGKLTIFPRAAVASMVALAAATALVLGLRGEEAGIGPLDPAAQTARVKGGAVAFALVRDDGERFVGPDGAYRDGDRFKAVVTCPPGGGVGFDVVVREGDRESFPLAPVTHFACGNEVPVPGAFRLTGNADETVCLVWNEGGAVDRGDSASLESLCKHLSPAPRR
jgi:hypothetical protein